MNQINTAIREMRFISHKDAMWQVEHFIQNNSAKSSEVYFPKETFDPVLSVDWSETCAGGS